METQTETNTQILVQGTQEWKKARAGRFTSSEIWKLTVEPRSKAEKEAGILSATARGYVLEKVQERLTGEPKPGFTSVATDWGNMYEDKAIERYEEVTGNKVREVGFLTYAENGGASTDGLVSFDGMIEVKCPYSDYLVRILEDVIENREYYLQIQMGLLTADRDWCDYIVFDPRMPEGQDIVIQRIGRDEDAIELIKECLGKAESWADRFLADAEKKFINTQIAQ